MPALRYGDVVDWTTFPLHSRPNGRRIERCPECGRKGEQSRYRAGGEGYVHVSRFETIFWMVQESCHIGPVS